MKHLLYVIAIAGIIASCSSDKTSSGSNKAAMNKERMQAFYDQVMNAHNPATVDSFCTADFIDHQADPRYPKGMEGLKANFTDFFTGYPDLSVKTNFMIAKGDTVIAEVTMTGTNSGPMMGMPATNKQINVDGVDIVVLKDGKATEHWGFYEEAKMFGQLGLMGGAPADSTKMNEPMEKK